MRRTVLKVIPKLLANPVGGAVNTGTIPLGPGNGLLKVYGPVKLSVAPTAQVEIPVLITVLPCPLKQVAFHVVWDENPSVFNPALPTCSVLGP